MQGNIGISVAARIEKMEAESQLPASEWPSARQLEERIDVDNPHLRSFHRCAAGCVQYVKIRVDQTPPDEKPSRTQRANESIE